VLEVRHEHGVFGRTTEDTGRVERRYDGCPDAGEQSPMLRQHEERTPPGHGPDGSPAEGHDHCPGMQFEVMDQSPTTAVDGPNRRRSVGRTAGDRVGDEEVPFKKASLVDGPPEHIARWPPERLSLDDLLGARRIADEDDAAGGVAAWADGYAESVRTQPRQWSMVGTVPA
jgi:hypothetical protein